MLDYKMIEIGYVNFGYFSPELSSENEYPDYIKNAVSEGVEKIQEVQNRRSLTFGFMTDIHYSQTHNHEIRTKRLMNAYREVKKRVGSDMLILGGDYTNDGCKDYKVNNYRELRALLDNEPYFPANGNHDDNSIWDLYIKADTSTHHLPTEEMYKVFYNHLPRLGAKFDEKNPGLYYYYDDDIKKVRYIFLDMSDIPYKVDENGKFIYTKQHTFALSQNQIEWLINDALSVCDESYDIVVIAHTFFFEGDKEAPRLKLVNDILDAYKSGENIDKKYCEGDFLVDVKAKFKNKKRGNIIACFTGHYHKDFVKYTDCGIPLIFVDCSIMYDYRTKRTDGDKSEIIFDMVNIDRDNKKIHLIRVGAGSDRIVEYK